MCIMRSMQSLSDDERRTVLGEVLMDELKAIHELVQDVPAIKKKVDKLEEDMSEVKAGIKVIKSVVKKHSDEIKELQGAVLK
jgi:hypothetical protein